MAYTFFLGKVIPFYCYTIDLKFGKNANSIYDGIQSVCSNLCKVCLATIGVCIFQCADFGWHAFLIYE